jgi:hypothetical protein
LVLLTQNGLTIFWTDTQAEGSTNGKSLKVKDIKHTGRFVEYITLLLKVAY